MEEEHIPEEVEEVTGFSQWQYMNPRVE